MLWNEKGASDRMELEPPSFGLKGPAAAPIEVHFSADDAVIMRELNAVPGRHMLQTRIASSPLNFQQLGGQRRPPSSISSLVRLQ